MNSLTLQLAHSRTFPAHLHFYLVTDTADIQAVSWLSSLQEDFTRAPDKQWYVNADGFLNTPYKQKAEFPGTISHLQLALNTDCTVKNGQGQQRQQPIQLQLTLALVAQCALSCCLLMAEFCTKSPTKCTLSFPLSICFTSVSLQRAPRTQKTFHSAYPSQTLPVIQLNLHTLVPI